jgi:hypothetical protein
MFILKYTQGIGADSFIKTYPDSSSILVRGADLDDAGNFVAAGNRAGRTYILKTNAVGAIAWQDALAGPETGRFYDVEISPSGDIYAVGFTDSLGTGSRNGLIVKYSSTGTLLWQKVVNAPAIGSPVASMIELSTVIAANSNSLYAAGYYDNTTDGQDIIIIKFNDDGDVIWQKTIATVLNDSSNHIEVDSSGNVYLSGFTQSGGGAGENDFYIVKFDSSGSILWQRLYGDINDDQGIGIRVPNDGYVYAAGRLSNGVDSDATLFKIDASDGSVVWSRMLVTGTTTSQQNIDLDSSGNIYVSGNEGTSSGVYVAKYNNSGVIQWQRKISSPNDELPFAIKKYSDFVYIIGRTRGPSAGTINEGLFARLTLDGDTTGTYGTVFTVSVSSYVEQAVSLTVNTPSLSFADTSFAITNGTLTQIVPTATLVDHPLA